MSDITKRPADAALSLGALSEAVLPRSVEPDARGEITCDIAIIGSGMGGSTMAYALADSGADILVIERGDFLPQESQNWSAEAVFGERRYKNAEQWYDRDGTPFDPGVYYYVGGNTKLYGAMLPRFREEDFAEIRHAGGVSPGWPISYADLEPFYAEAERIYRVHGEKGTDPTDPWRSGDYPQPALRHDAALERLARSLRSQGLHPFSMPAAVDYGVDRPCILCRTCDGFPCKVNAKRDADISALRPAAAKPNVRLLTRALIDTLRTDRSGKTVVEALGSREGRRVRVKADRFVVAGGAVNSAALLLRSAQAGHPEGLGNSSGQLGRRYMVHNSTFLVAVDPRRRNTVSFQKTLAFNDWYLTSPWGDHPLGNVQMLGKLTPPMIRAARPWVPQSILRYMTERSVDLYLTSEDLPTQDNRVLVDTRTGRTIVHWTPNNLRPHEELTKRTVAMMRRAGYPLVFTDRMGIATNSHQCGTAVMGEDPVTSVVDVHCKMHDLTNVWIADSSSFLSSAAVNPALTIAANALRVAAHGGIAV